METITYANAAQGAADELGVEVSEASIKLLVRSHALTSTRGRNGGIDKNQFKMFLKDIGLPGQHQEAIRVSVNELSPAELGFICPDGTTRSQAGVDYRIKGGDSLETWTGVWRLAELVCAQASANRLPLLAASKGWVRKDYARTIVGYQLATDTPRALRWLLTDKLDHATSEAIFGNHDWVYIQVSPGPTAAHTTL